VIITSAAAFYFAMFTWLPMKKVNKSSAAQEYIYALVCNALSVKKIASLSHFLLNAEGRVMNK
jgi:hypothetical protein